MLVAQVFVLDSAGTPLYEPPAVPGRPLLKLSQCAPLFQHAFTLRRAGACIHSHAVSAVMVTLKCETEFRIVDMEMIKGLAGHGYHDMLVVPIIDNTPHEADLADSLEEAIRAYPRTSAVLVSVDVSTCLTAACLCMWACVFACVCVCVCACVCALASVLSLLSFFISLSRLWLPAAAHVPLSPSLCIRLVSVCAVVLSFARFSIVMVSVCECRCDDTVCTFGVRRGKRPRRRPSACTTYLMPPCACGPSALIPQRRSVVAQVSVSVSVCPGLVLCVCASWQGVDVTDVQYPGHLIALFSLLPSLFSLLSSLFLPLFSADRVPSSSLSSSLSSSVAAITGSGSGGRAVAAAAPPAVCCGGDGDGFRGVAGVAVDTATVTASMPPPPPRSDTIPTGNVQQPQVVQRGVGRERSPPPHESSRVVAQCCRWRMWTRSSWTSKARRRPSPS